MFIPEIHIAELDRDHKEFLHFLSYIQSGVGSSDKLIRELTKYLSAHILKEEALMEEVQYPHREAHKMSHKYMRQIIEDMITDVIQHPSRETESLINSVVNIFANHIQVFDKKFADWYNNQEVKNSTHSVFPY